MAQKEREYNIPENYIKSGRIINGMFKTMNFVEAVLLGGVFALIAASFPIQSMTIRTSVIVFFSFPWFILCIMGINDDSFLTFVYRAIKWKKTGALFLYNPKPQPREAEAVDMMMSEELPKDKIISAFSKWNQDRIDKLNQKQSQMKTEIMDDEELARLKTPTQQKEEKIQKMAKKNHIEAGSIKQVNELEASEIEVFDPVDDFSIEENEGTYLNDSDLY